MTERIVKRFLLYLIAWSAVAMPSYGQVMQMFHATGPVPSYEVATIKKADASGGPQPMMPPPGGGPPQTVTLTSTTRNLILSAYGVSTLSQTRVVGGPAWIDTDMYVIQGKVPDDLRSAMQKMTLQERQNQDLMMRESLLADRFKLKMHFETREVPVYELTAAKGGLKFKQVPTPPPFDPGAPPPPAALGGALRPGSVNMQTKGGLTVLNAPAASMRLLINLLKTDAEVSGKPILDKTGFAGNFDIVDLEWAGMSAGPDADGPSLPTALEEKLGLKLMAAKGLVEVIVIDHIERPSEN